MRKVLGFCELVAIGVGGMVGGGIFAVLGLAVELAGPATPIAFLLAGVIALLTAISYAKLSIAYPSRGGTVEFVAVAFKNGVLAGAVNTLLLLSYTIMLSLYAYAFGSYTSALFGVEALRRMFSAGVIALFVLVNLRGTRSVGRVEDIIVLLKVLILIVFIFAGMHSLRFSKVFSAKWPDILSILAGGMMIFLAYEGFELIANASEEADERAIERAFYVSVLFVMALYILTALVAVGNVSLQVLVHARDYALAEAAKPVLGSVGFLLISVAAILSTASAINATLYGSARVAYTIAAEGELPRVLAKSAGNSPLAGLLLVAFSALFISSTVDLSGISAMGSAGFLVVFTAVNAAAFKLSDKINIPKIVPGCAMVLTALAFAVLCIEEGMSRPGNMVLLLTLTCASLVVEVTYRFLTRRKIRLRFWSERNF